MKLRVVSGVAPWAGFSRERKSVASGRHWK